LDLGRCDVGELLAKRDDRCAELGRPGRTERLRGDALRTEHCNCGTCAGGERVSCVNGVFQRRESGGPAAEGAVKTGR